MFLKSKVWSQSLAPSTTGGAAKACLTARAQRQRTPGRQVTSESMGQINKATRLIQLITPCEVVLYSSFLAEGRYHVAAVRALSCVILRLHLQRECSGEGDGCVVKRTPPVPREATCEMYSVFHQPLYLLRLAYPCV